MPKPFCIELGRGPDAVSIPIMHEDRAVMVLDKPAGWMLAPVSWQRTRRNLQAAVESSIAARDFWARTRNLKFLRFVHRLDAETSGLLLCVKSPGAVKPFSDLFESRRVEKTYLAVVHGAPVDAEWTCRLELAGEGRNGLVRVDKRHGKTAETHFRALQKRADARGEVSLVEAHPTTGRTHQIRVHAAESGHGIVGDTLYGKKIAGGSKRFPLALRAIRLCYPDPFTGKRVRVEAPVDEFLTAFGFTSLRDAVSDSAE